MLAPSALSRRVLVAAGLLAAPAVAAKKKRRKRKPKPPPSPLAFVAAVVNTSPPVAPSTAFQWHLDATVVHPASGTTKSFAPAVSVALAATTVQVRAALERGLQESASSQLLIAGQSVPDDRIAVAVL
jgi:hypothetical protein